MIIIKDIVYQYNTPDYDAKRIHSELSAALNYPINKERILSQPTFDNILLKLDFDPSIVTPDNVKWDKLKPIILDAIETCKLSFEEVFNHPKTIIVPKAIENAPHVDSKLLLETIICNYIENAFGGIVYDFITDYSHSPRWKDVEQ